MPPNSCQHNSERLVRIARFQDGVVSRRQLASCGYDADAIRRRVLAGRWQVSGSAIVLHNGAPSPRQQQWAAILTAPGIAAIGGRAACATYGLRGFAPEALDVVVGATVKPISMPGVHWRRSRRFSADDVSDGWGVPIVARSRAVIDAAAWTDSPRVACGLVAATVQQGIVAVRSLRQELANVGQVRHCRLLSVILADIEGGADSLAEIDLVRFARRAGLPPPIRQSIRTDHAGRRRYLDADFGTFSVEVDGGFHIKPLNYWDDVRRHNDLLLVGERILRFPSIAFHLEPEVVEEQLRAAHKLFG